MYQPRILQNWTKIYFNAATFQRKIRFRKKRIRSYRCRLRFFQKFRLTIVPTAYSTVYTLLFILRLRTIQFCLQTYFNPRFFWLRARTAIKFRYLIKLHIKFIQRNYVHYTLYRIHIFYLYHMHLIYRTIRQLRKTRKTRHLHPITILFVPYYMASGKFKKRPKIKPQRLYK